MFCGQISFDITTRHLPIGRNDLAAFKLGKTHVPHDRRKTLINVVLLFTSTQRCAPIGFDFTPRSMISVVDAQVECDSAAQARRILNAILLCPVSMTGSRIGFVPRFGDRQRPHKPRTRSNTADKSRLGVRNTKNC